MSATPFVYADLIRKEFLGVSDRAAAIVGGVFVDEILTSLLKSFYVPDKESDKNLFAGSGPLATFSAKIDMAYRLGLITKTEHGMIHSVRSIRNVFAHEMSDTTFENQSIKDKCRNVSVPHQMLVPDFIVLSEDNKTQRILAPLKIDSGDSRGIFQEAISHLMRVLAARICQATDSLRNPPKDFCEAHEPILVVSNQMKERYEKLMGAIEEAKSQGLTNMDGIIKNTDELHHIVRQQEQHIEQLKHPT